MSWPRAINGLARGLLYKEIARELHISYSAVNKHQQRIYRKLHADNRTEAINKWRESCQSWFSPPESIQLLATPTR